MTSTTTIHALVACAIALCVCCAASAAGKGGGDAKAQATGTPPAPSERRLSGPYTHENLTIYLVHGPSTLKGNYLTLEEAMAAKLVKVHETGDVNELAIENVGREPVFVQSGDIVKGGKQDRCIATDFTLEPKSDKVKIASFCVEQGRWRQRGGESASFFSSSSATVTGKKLKLAGNANYSGGGGQGKVWEEVSAAQQQLSRNVNADVAAAASPSSLQLTLENEKVQAAIEKYVKALSDAPGGKEDVIGYAAVINGKMNCADVYGSTQLFTKIWPRSLKSVATEAAAEARPGEKTAELPADQVQAAMRDAADGKRTENRVGDGVEVITTDSNDSVLFESRARGEAGYLRQSIVNKGD
jgi:hypothetical protein